MPYSPYHTGYNPINKDYQSIFGSYCVKHMCDGPWTYIMDDFGDAVPIPTNCHAVAQLFKRVGI